MDNSNGIIIPTLSLDSCKLINKLQEEQINKTKTEETKASDLLDSDALSNDSLIGSKNSQSPLRIESLCTCDRQISFSIPINNPDFSSKSESENKNELISQSKASIAEKNAKINQFKNETMSACNQFQYHSQNQYNTFIHPYDRCRTITNPASLSNINMKIFRQNYNQPANQNKTEQSEFSVLHSDFLTKKLAINSNNEVFNKNVLPAKQNNPLIKNTNLPLSNGNSYPNKMNFSLNSITMFNNMAIQMNILKIMMQQQFLMQNQSKKIRQSQMQAQVQYNQAMKDCFNHKQEIPPMQQPQPQLQPQQQQQIQQRQSQPQQYYQSLLKMNIQNNLSSSKAGTFIHPYIPANNQVVNPYLNFPKILQQIKEKYPKKTEMKQNNETSYNDIQNQQFDEDYLSKGSILKGTIMLDRSRSQGYVKVKGLTNEIYINDKSLYLSLNQDEVLVKLFPVSTWKPCQSIRETKISIFSEDNTTKSGCNEEDHKSHDIIQSNQLKSALLMEKNMLKKELSNPTNKSIKTKEELLTFCNLYCFLRPEGQVIKIIKSPNQEKELVCYLEHDNSILYAFPIDETLPKVFILQKKNQDNEILVKNRYYIVKLKGWDKNCQVLQGEIVNEIGNCGQIEVESEVLLRHYSIDYNHMFNQNIINEVHSKINSLVINDAFIKETGRVDLRKEIIFTVDPTCSKDLDDAISVKLINKEKGLLEIGVHIADPSYLVTKNSLLDLEAIKRVTTIYLVQKNIPMLPKIISDNYCSLLPYQDRLTVTCTFRIYLNGSLDQTYKPKFELSVIQSKAKWNYNLVQKIITGEGIEYKKLREEDGTKPKTIDIFNQMVEGIHLLQQVTKIVREQRFQSGSLLIQNTNLNFIIDDKTLLPTSYRLSRKADSHNLIEELMIIANKLCAEYLYENMKEFSIIRKHPFLNDNTYEEVKRYLITHGIIVTSKIPFEFNNKMNDLRQNEQQFYCIQNKLKNLLVKAEYVMSGHSPFKSLCHSSLNFDLYTHFTSPIRRYSDMIAHRQLKDIIDYKNKKITEEQYREHFECYTPLMESFNEKYFIGKQISDKSSWLFKCIYIKNSNKKEYKGLIVDLFKTLEKGKAYTSDVLSVLFYIPDLHLEIEWKKEDNLNVTKVQLTNMNEMLIEYKNCDNKEMTKTLKVFDAMIVELNVVISGPLNVKCCLKLD